MVSLMPRYWRSAPAAATHSPPASRPASAMATFTPMGDMPTIRCPITAAARPPSTSAPSLPMIIRPAWAGSATHSAVRIKGAARDSVFCQEKELEKPPW